MTSCVGSPGGGGRRGSRQGVTRASRLMRLHRQQQHLAGMAFDDLAHDGKPRPQPCASCATRTKRSNTRSRSGSGQARAVVPTPAPRDPGASGSARSRWRRGRRSGMALSTRFTSASRSISSIARTGGAAPGPSPPGPGRLGSGRRHQLDRHRAPDGRGRSAGARAAAPTGLGAPLGVSAVQQVRAAGGARGTRGAAAGEAGSVASPSASSVWGFRPASGVRSWCAASLMKASAPPRCAAPRPAAW